MSFVLIFSVSISEIAILQQSMAGYVSTTAFKAFRQLRNRLAIQSVLVRVVRPPSSDAI